MSLYYSPFSGSFAEKSGKKTRNAYILFKSIKHFLNTFILFTDKIIKREKSIIVLIIFLQKFSPKIKCLLLKIFFL